MASANHPDRRKRPTIALNQGSRMSWPEESVFRPINEAELVRCDKVRCIRAALCDHHLNPSAVFHQGETGRLFYDFNLSRMFPGRFLGFAFEIARD